MKHNWEYRPFAKILKTITPTSKIEKSEYQTRGLYPIISQEDVFISGFWDNSDDITHHSTPVVIFGDHSRVLKYIDFEFVVGADGVKIIQPIGSLNAKFLYHFLKWHNVPSLGYSRHFKLLKEVNYPVPPMGVQEQIVAELDQINDLIAKNRELLSQLDALAQSLFYDTFGDPITNPKGWNTSQLGALCNIVGRIGFRGYTRNDLVNKGEGAITLSPSNIVNGSLNYENCSYISWYKYEESPEIKIFNGDVLLTKTGSTVGKVGCVFNLPEKATINPQLVVLKNLSINNRYLSFTLRDNAYQDIIRDKSGGSAVPTISQKILATIVVPVPPLALQEEFAAKVEAIEAQKAKVEAEIAELQTLLSARMDYWFN